MKNKKTALAKSSLALLLSAAMLIGSTFAWFTDSATSTGNIIQSGKLAIEMYWTDDLDAGEWYNVEDPAHNTIFHYDNWEPGYTDVKYIKLVNKGNLALNYKLTLTPQNGVGKLAEVINVHFAEGAVDLQNRSDLSNLGAIGLLSNVLNGGATASGTLLAANQTSPLHPSGEVIMTMAMNMIETAGNEYQNKDAGDFTVTALATQAAFESDSFGSDYDINAEYPTILKSKKASAPVTPVNNKVPAGGVTIIGEDFSAIVPEGVLLESGTNNLTLTITPLKETTSDVTPVNNEILRPVDVHISGVSEDNTVPIIIDLGETLPKYLNMGNVTLIHVENGVDTLMTCVSDRSDLTAHNRFTYDSDTGAVTVAMASFSELASIVNVSKPWEGKYDYVFVGSGSKEDPYLISTADELAGFGAIVGGMNSQQQNSYTDKYFKLIADINLGGNKNIFYPIGYYNNTGSYEKTNAANVSSSVWSFEGTFDGAGHTISNFYQNTWDMFGDYNSGYAANSNHYKDAMGLFGYVLNGTIKNLTVSNFSSDGEFTPTGVIAAYAANSTFENIAITNCNPRVYNTGNGGIVGIGGNDNDPEGYKLTFNNITIDNSNKITALWGSWDVACGGLVGMFRGAGHVHMNNCNVAAQMDVYNDVCGNYQYYWYRYSGMLIGTNKNMITDNKGYTVPETSKYHASNCTVFLDSWNDYYYCELVANSLASYTHDHQFSRLEVISALSEIKDETGWKKTGNFLLKSGDTMECYHIVNKNGVLTQHLHEDAGYETNIDEDKDGNVDLKEDKQIVYLPFNQLFTGYGWGVKHVPVTDWADKGITVLQQSANEHFETVVSTDLPFYVGNQNAFTIDKLFKARNGKTINTSGVYVSVTSADKNMIGGTFTLNTNDWTKSTLKIEGTGLAKITIQDYDYCTPTVLYVNVVDAPNVSGEGATLEDGNVVLLDNATTTTNALLLENKTLYGNGYALTLPANGSVTLGNSKLENVAIVVPDQSATTDAVVTVSGNCTIIDSSISAPRTGIAITGGTVLIENTTVSGKADANIEVTDAATVTLKNLTTEQIVNGAPAIGWGVKVTNASAKIVVEGELTQHNWIDDASFTTVGVADETYKEFWHKNTAGNKYMNLAMHLASESQLTDNRTGKDSYKVIGNVYAPTNLGTLTNDLTIVPGVYTIDGELYAFADRVGEFVEYEGKMYRAYPTFKEAYKAIIGNGGTIVVEDTHLWYTEETAQNPIKVIGLGANKSFMEFEKNYNCLYGDITVDNLTMLTAAGYTDAMIAIDQFTIGPDTATVNSEEQAVEIMKGTEEPVWAGLLWFSGFNGTDGKLGRLNHLGYGTRFMMNVCDLGWAGAKSSFVTHFSEYAYVNFNLRVDGVVNGNATYIFDSVRAFNDKNIKVTKNPSGALSLVFNNGTTYVLDSGSGDANAVQDNTTNNEMEITDTEGHVDYILSVQEGGYADIREQATGTTAPTFVITAPENKAPYVNGEEIEANANGEFLFTPDLNTGTKAAEFAITFNTPTRPIPYTIGGVKHVFAASDGKVDYNGTTYRAYTTFESAYEAIKATGGTIVVEGTNLTAVKDLNAPAAGPIKVVGLGSANTTLTLPNYMDLRAPFEFDNLTLKAYSSGTILRVANITFSEGCTVSGDIWIRNPIKNADNSTTIQKFNGNLKINVFDFGDGTTPGINVQRIINCNVHFDLRIDSGAAQANNVTYVINKSSGFDDKRLNVSVNPIGKLSVIFNNGINDVALNDTNGYVDYRLNVATGGYAYIKTEATADTAPTFVITPPNANQAPFVNGTRLTKNNAGEYLYTPTQIGTFDITFN